MQSAPKVEQDRDLAVLRDSLDDALRVLNERESVRRERFSDNKSEDKPNLSEETKTQNEEVSKSNIANEAKKDNEEEKVPETQA